MSEIQRLQRIAELARIVIEPMYFYAGDEFNAYQIGWPSDEVEAAVKELRELLGIVYE